MYDFYLGILVDVRMMIFQISFQLVGIAELTPHSIHMAIIFEYDSIISFASFDRCTLVPLQII